MIGRGFRQAEDLTIEMPHIASTFGDSEEQVGSLEELGGSWT